MNFDWRFYAFNKETKCWIASHDLAAEKTSEQKVRHGSCLGAEISAMVVSRLGMMNGPCSRQRLSLQIWHFCEVCAVQLHLLPLLQQEDVTTKQC